MSCVVLLLIWCGLTRAAAFTWGVSWGPELTQACWALNRPDLPMWSLIFTETRPGFFTWWQEHSKKASSNVQAVINPLLASHLLTSHWPKSHTHTQTRVTMEGCGYWKGWFIAGHQCNNLLQRLPNGAITSSNPSNTWSMLFFNKVSFLTAPYLIFLRAKISFMGVLSSY